MAALLRALIQVRRRLLIHRRPLAALCAGLAVLLAVTALRPPDPERIELWTAARDLASGTVLELEDLRRTAFLPESTPRAATTDVEMVLGRVLATPLSQGEVLTPDKVIGSDLLRGHPGTTAIPLRIPDSAVVELLRVGDRIEVIATDPQGGRPAEHLVSADVLAIPEADDGVSGPGLLGRLVLLAIPSGEVTHVAEVGTSNYLTVTWNR